METERQEMVSVDIKPLASSSLFSFLSFRHCWVKLNSFPMARSPRRSARYERCNSSLKCDKTCRPHAIVRIQTYQGPDLSTTCSSLTEKIAVKISDNAAYQAVW